MLELNDLRVFERVAALRSFSAASRSLDIPKSSVSRSIQRLEAAIGQPLMQRTTRDVRLTDVGALLYERCAHSVGELEDTIRYVLSLRDGPRGILGLR